MSKKKKIWIAISVALVVLVVSASIITVIHFAKEQKEKREWENTIRVYRETKISSYITENEQYDDYEVDVAFLGDSLTDGYNVKDYYSQYTVVNRGIGGDTTFDLEERLQVSVYDLKPKVAVMLIGANNFRTMFDNYECIVQGLKNNLPNTEIVLLSLTAMSGDYWGKNNEVACFNNIKIRHIAQEYDCTFIDLFTPLFDNDSDGIHESYTTDGGHLTSDGYEVITGVITPVIQELLNNYSL